MTTGEQLRALVRKLEAECSTSPVMSALPQYVHGCIARKLRIPFSECPPFVVKDTAVFWRLGWIYHAYPVNAHKTLRGTRC